jgi:hypothetical protein
MVNSNINAKMTMNREEQLYLAAIINAERHQKLHELAHMIRGTPEGPGGTTKGASSTDNKPRKRFKVTIKSSQEIEKYHKLRELGEMIKGL